MAEATGPNESRPEATTRFRPGRAGEEGTIHPALALVTNSGPVQAAVGSYSLK